MQIERLVGPAAKKFGTALRIISFCVVVSVTYSILHDLITANLCVEYFTVGHEKIFGDHPPVMLGLLWGSAAGLAPGLLMGIIMCWACMAGPYPSRSIEVMIPKARILVTTMALGALLSGLAGYSLAAAGVISLPPIYAGQIDISRHKLFFADWFAHGASYLIGYAGSVVIALQIRRERKNDKPS